MLNYQTKHSEPDSRWRDYQLMIDPGAYSMFAPHPVGQGHEDYPNSTASYLHDIGRIQPERYAWRDYVCEQDVREYHDWTVQQQLDRTTERHIECANLHADLGISAEPVAVVQGWTPEQYRRHAQTLADHGLVTERVGIGTMCGRGDTETCEEIVAAVRDFLPEAKIHAFGLDRSAYSSEYLIEELTSTDSLAYCYRQQRPAGWARWEYVLTMYLQHRADWDAAIGGAEYRRCESDERGQQTLSEVSAGAE